MAFTNQSYRNDYIGTGFVTIYDYTFKIFSETHLRVLVANVAGEETELNPNANFTVQGAGRATGGTVTLVNGALPAGYHLAIIRHLPFVQNTDLRNMGGYFPEVVEDQFDRLVIIDMQQQDQLDHALKVPMTLDASTISPVLPPPEAGSAIGWNDTEDGLINIPIDLTGDDFVRLDGTSIMTGPLVIRSATGSIVLGDQVDPNINYEIKVINGTLHWQQNGTDKMTLNDIGLFVIGRVFGNNGGIGLGRITASTGAPPADGQEGDIHFQF